MKKLLLASALGLATLIATPVFAAGAFDFLDPCIKARSGFSEQRQQVREKFTAVNASVESMTYTPEFKEEWLRASRIAARPIFDTDIKPQLEKMGVADFEKAFDIWFNHQIASVASEDLDKLINQTYREIAKNEIAHARAKTEAEYDQAKGELDSSCKNDVGSQALRVVVAPIGWVGGNFESAKNEHNIVTQVFKAVTGISPKDIAENGLLGGEKSEARKVANAIAGGEKSAVRVTLRFLDPGNIGGIFGGSNSFFRKPFG